MISIANKEEVQWILPCKVSQQENPPRYLDRKGR